MSKKNRSIIPDTSPKIIQRESLNEDLHIRQFQWTENQKKIVECVLSKDSKIVFIEGPSGSGKSLLSTYCALNLLNSGKSKELIFIRSPLESSDSAGMGYVPGKISEKFEPYKMVLDEKLKELLKESEINKLWADSRIVPTPLNYIRGLSFNVKFILAEECNNFTLSEFKLLLTRYGQFSKLLIIGDFFQTDLPKNKQGAFKKVFGWFNNQESKDKGIHCFNLEKQDILRSNVTAYIIEKFEEAAKPIETNSEMFPLTKL